MTKSHIINSHWNTCDFQNQMSCTEKIDTIVNNKNPLYDEEIVSEYKEVLSRSKFSFLDTSVARLIRTMMDKGVKAERIFSGETFPDASDAVFYEVALSKDGSYLFTGNKNLSSILNYRVFNMLNLTLNKC